MTYYEWMCSWMLIVTVNIPFGTFCLIKCSKWKIKMVSSKRGVQGNAPASKSVTLISADPLMMNMTKILWSTDTTFLFKYHQNPQYSSAVKKCFASKFGTFLQTSIAHLLRNMIIWSINHTFVLKYHQHPQKPRAVKKCEFCTQFFCRPGNPVLAGPWNVSQTELILFYHT